MTSIGEAAFNYCTRLPSITIPGNVKTIGNAAFASCIFLQNITIEEGVTTIAANAFEDCSTWFITIPASVTSIGSRALSMSGIGRVDINGKTKAQIQGMANRYWGLPRGCVIYPGVGGDYIEIT